MFVLTSFLPEIVNSKILKYRGSEGGQEREGKDQRIPIGRKKERRGEVEKEVGRRGRDTRGKE